MPHIESKIPAPPAPTRLHGRNQTTVLVTPESRRCAPLPALPQREPWLLSPARSARAPPAARRPLLPLPPSAPRPSRARAALCHSAGRARVRALSALVQPLAPPDRRLQLQPVRRDHARAR